MLPALIFILMFLTPDLVAASQNAVQLIRHKNSPVLQQQLNTAIDNLHLSRAARQKRLAVALVDISDLDNPNMAHINGDEMMYAASLPKIAVLLAAFERIDEGSMRLDDQTRKTLTEMIRYSSNSAATSVIRAVGKDYINQVLASDKYKLYDPDYNGGLWVGKEYGQGKAFHRDPMHGLSHGATAIQVARFYYMLETGRLVSPAASLEMKEILSRPGIQHKFVKGLLHTTARIFRKSGSWRTFHADSAIIEHDDRRYIAVALANDRTGGIWMTRLIKEMDKIIATHGKPRKKSGLETLLTPIEKVLRPLNELREKEE